MQSVYSRYNKRYLHTMLQSQLGTTRAFCASLQSLRQAQGICLQHLPSVVLMQCTGFTRTDFNGIIAESAASFFCSGFCNRQVSLPRQNWMVIGINKNKDDICWVRLCSYCVHRVSRRSFTITLLILPVSLSLIFFTIFVSPALSHCLTYSFFLSTNF